MPAQWLLLAAQSLLLAHSFKTCTKADHVHASHLILVPDEPVPGKDVHVNVSVKPDLVVTGGTVGIQASLFGVAVPGGGKDYTICHVTKCPVTAGKNATVTLSYPLSKLIPSGIRPTLRVDVKDGSGKEIGCLEFDVTIGSRGASLSDHSKRRLEFERAVVEEPEWRPVYEAWRREAA